MDESSVSDWIKEARSQCARRGWASLHVNELVPTPIGSQALIAESFRILRVIDRDIQGECQVALHLALPPSRRLVRRAPSEATAIGFARFEPPSLYMLSLRHAAEYSRFEEYRTPWESAVWTSPPNLSSYYRVYRDPRSIDQDWEYGRSFVWESSVVADQRA